MMTTFPLKLCLLTTMLITIISVGLFSSTTYIQAEEESPDPNDIVVARLIHQDKKSSKCFNHAFLSEVDRRSNVNVHRQFANVTVGSKDIFKYPMLIMNGEKAFQLTDAEKQNLKTYLQRGGFILASADCSDKKWNQSFIALMKELFPENPLEKLDMKHPVFSTLFKIERIISVKPVDDAIMGLSINNRLSVVYSPIGLNDAANMGADCCCCGANEIRNARQVNANTLVYAVSH